MEKNNKTRVVYMFPNEVACLRLVSAVLMVSSDEWEAGCVYLSSALSGL
jgi:transposase-like protein